jgi:hypothetical protein
VSRIDVPFFRPSALYRSEALENGAHPITQGDFMADATATFEQIDLGIQKLKLADYQPGGKAHLTAEAVRANPAAALPQICPIYKAIRPILLILSNLPLIPETWRSAIKAFIGIMDALCP